MSDHSGWWARIGPGKNTLVRTVATLQDPDAGVTTGVAFSGMLWNLLGTFALWADRAESFVDFREAVRSSIIVQIFFIGSARFAIAPPQDFHRLSTGRSP